MASVADLYEEAQAWPAEIAGSLARYVLSSHAAKARRCLVAGAATGLNDALPLARSAGPGDRILAGDIDPSCLERLRERAAAEGLRNLRVRRLDVTGDLSFLGRFDLLTLFFVIHRVDRWEAVVDRLCARLAPGGSFFISEFAGPGGLVYLSNEGGATSFDPVSRLLRRYFDLRGTRYQAPLRSSLIGPVRARLGSLLQPREHRDWSWRQVLTPADVLRRIEQRAFAPFRSVPPTEDVLARLRVEMAGDLHRPVELEETIRVFRFENSPR